MASRVLFHIDLNAFYASAEELRHPEYKDLPIAIGSMSSRSVLSTANYKAREYGVHSAMPSLQAKQLCPDLVLIPGDYAYYRSLSGKFFEYLRRYSTKLEILSVDECFLDVTEIIRQYKRPLDLAVQIQQGVKEELGLSCSIGVAPTKFLAKMASDMRKPMGITVLRISEIPSKLWPLPIQEVVGIGKKTVPLLEEAGIHTIGDLAEEVNPQAARRILGKNYDAMMAKIRGRSSNEISYSNTRKSISHARTFHRDLYSLEEVLDEAANLIRDLTDKMQRAHKKGAQISVTLRDTDFNNAVRSSPLPGYTNDYAVIFNAARNLFTEHFEPVGYRLIGVTIGSLQDEDRIVEQGSLFEPAMSTADDVVSQLNKSAKQNEDLKAAVFMKASDLLKRRAPAETNSQKASSAAESLQPSLVLKASNDPKQKTKADESDQNHPAASEQHPKQVKDISTKAYEPEY